MIIECTIFGKTRLVKAHPRNMKEDETPDEVLWVERPEDEYALMSPQLKTKKVAIVYRDDWIRAGKERGAE